MCARPSPGLREPVRGTAKLSRIRERDSPKFGLLKQLFFEHGPHAFTLALADRHRLTTERFTLIRPPLLTSHPSICAPKAGVLCPLCAQVLHTALGVGSRGG